MCVAKRKASSKVFFGKTHLYVPWCAMNSRAGAATRACVYSSGYSRDLQTCCSNKVDHGLCGNEVPFPAQPGKHEKASRADRLGCPLHGTGLDNEGATLNHPPALQNP